MHTISRRNAIIASVFFLCNVLSLLLEKQMGEPAAETLGILLYLALFLSLTVANRNTFSCYANSMHRLFARYALMIGLFTGLWGIAYVCNWHIIIPLIYR